jgi:hypothetical protein
MLQRPLIFSSLKLWPTPFDFDPFEVAAAELAR